MKTASAKKSAGIRYAALLRGINVGGNVLIKMDALRTALEAMGLTEVKTVLASGNVVFTATEKNTALLTKKIEAQLETAFGRKISVLLRSITQLMTLAKAKPFKGVNSTPNTRLYVTFLSEKPKSPLKVPYASPDKAFRVLRGTESELCSVLELTPGKRTVDLMSVLEKAYGKKVTTRNWNTIERILRA